MAAVTQCDVCGNVVKHAQAKFVKVFDCSNAGDATMLLHAKDLCPDCYDKLKKLLKAEDKK